MNYIGVQWSELWSELDMLYKTSEKDEKHDKDQSFELAKKWL